MGKGLEHWSKCAVIQKGTDWLTPSCSVLPFIGLPEHSSQYPHLTRFVVWRNRQWRMVRYTCRTRYVRDVCIFGVVDLPALKFNTRRELFLNKLHLTYQPLLLDCLEEYYFNRTRAERNGFLRPFQEKSYSEYQFVWNHTPSWPIC